jgi:hypothetical protein
MLSLRRFLLAALLTGLVLGCKPKFQPVGVEETPEKHLERKFKLGQEEPEGPQFRP